MKLIKKYKNRRLYDVEGKMHITLSHLSDLISRGEIVKVVDSESGEDITAITLAQAILEEERRGKTTRATPFLLMELLKKGRSTIIEFIEHALLMGVETISMTKERARNLVQELVDRRRISSAEGERLLNSLLGRIKESGKILEEKIEGIVGKVLAKMDVPRREEFKKLTERLDKIQGLLKKTTTELGGGK